jgi:hypothetical protein
MFEYEINDGELSYRWNDVIDGFDMPLEVTIDGEIHLLNPSTKFKKMKIESLFIKVDKDYYVFNKDLKVIIDN